MLSDDGEPRYVDTDWQEPSYRDPATFREPSPPAAILSTNLPNTRLLVQEYDLDADQVWRWVLQSVVEGPTIDNVDATVRRLWRLADALGRVHGDLTRLVGVLTADGQQVWSGHAQVAFKEAADKLLTFALKIQDAVLGMTQHVPEAIRYRFPDGIQRASLHWVTDGLAESMKKVRHILLEEVPYKNYTNNGAEWTTIGIQEYKFDEDQYWLEYAKNRWVIVNHVSVDGRGGLHSYERTLTVGELDAAIKSWSSWLWPFLDRDAVVSWMEREKVAFLNRQQRVLFNTLATALSMDYAHYYRYIPRVPTWESDGTPVAPSDLPLPTLPPSGLTDPSFGTAALDGALSAGSSLSPPSLEGMSLPGVGGGDLSSLSSGVPLTPRLVPSSGVDIPTSLAGVPSLSGLVTPTWATPSLSPGQGLPSLGLPGSLDVTGGSGVNVPGRVGGGVVGPAPLSSGTGLIRGQPLGTMPMLPPIYPPLGAAGARGPNDEANGSGLTEDDDFWVERTTCPPPVIGAVED